MSEINNVNYALNSVFLYSNLGELLFASNLKYLIIIVKNDNLVEVIL